MRFDPESKPQQPGWRQNLYEIVFETETGWGKRFDISLLVLVALNIVTIGLETVDSVQREHGQLLYALEWVFTVLFSLEYLLRLVIVERPARYVLSTVGLIDLISLLPTYLGPFVGTSAVPLKILRALRLLRVFRVFQMAAFVREGEALLGALRSSAQKITVFIVVVLLIALVAGSLMYFVEGSRADTPFTSIPMAVYWAIVTMTTVGYGDVVPRSAFGQGLAATLMVLAYGILAVPTGIVTAQMVRDGAPPAPRAPRRCPSCSASVDPQARFCSACGTRLAQPDAAQTGDL